MVRLQPRHKIPKALSSVPVLFIMVCISLAMLVGIVRMAAKTRVTSAQAREAKNTLTMLETEHEKLVADISSLQTDEGRIEALRDNYRAGTEGEKLVVIVKEEVEPDEESGSNSGFKRFFQRLFGE